MKKSFVAYGGACLLAGVLCCFIISCGQGVVDPLKDEYDSKRDITEGGLIDVCFPPEGEEIDSEYYDLCWELIDQVEVEPSSSSEYELSSSSDDYYEPSSSSDYYEPGSSSRPSSSSGGGRPSSSSEGEVEPSSSGTTIIGGGDCPKEKEGDIDFTCGWESVYSGKIFKPMINGGDGCAKTISLSVVGDLGRNYMVYFENGKDYTTGTEQEFCLSTSSTAGTKFCWPDTKEKNQELGIEATVTCDNSCKTKTCPLKLMASDRPIPKGKISCDWSPLPNNGSNKYLSIGADTPDCDVSGVSIENGGEDQADCDPVSYEKSGSTSAPGKVIGKAVAMCSRSKWTLDSLVFDVVEDPTLGACTWKDDKVILAKGNEAIPSVELSNDYKRCGDGKVKFSGGFPRDLTESDVGTVKVTASVECDKNGEKVTIEKSCPDLTVKSAIYEIDTKGSTGKISLPAEETIVKVVLPTSNWQHNDAFIVCEIPNIASGKCDVSVASASTGCSVTTASLTGQNYLGRMSIGKPTCETFDLKITPTSNCADMKCFID